MEHLKGSRFYLVASVRELLTEADRIPERGLIRLRCVSLSSAGDAGFIVADHSGQTVLQWPKVNNVFSRTIGVDRDQLLHGEVISVPLLKLKKINGEIVVVRAVSVTCFWNDNNPSTIRIFGRFAPAFNPIG